MLALADNFKSIVLQKITTKQKRKRLFDTNISSEPGQSVQFAGGNQFSEMFV